MVTGALGSNSDSHLARQNVMDGWDGAGPGVLSIFGGWGRGLTVNHGKQRVWRGSHSLHGKELFCRYLENCMRFVALQKTNYSSLPKSRYFFRGNQLSLTLVLNKAEILFSGNSAIIFLNFISLMYISNPLGF